MSEGNRPTTKTFTAAEGPGASGARPDLLVHAHILARRRRRREALNCLADALAAGQCTEAQALDLKARVHVQQGQLLLAEACWQRAQALEPDEIGYTDALAALRRGQRPYMAWREPAFGGALAILLIVLIAVTAAAGRRAAEDRERVERRMLQLEQLIAEVQTDVDGMGEVTKLTIAPLARTADVDASTRRAVADLRRDIERWQRESAAREARSRAALIKAVQDLEARLRVQATAAE